MPRRVPALLTALVAVLLISGTAAQGAVTPAHLYDCRPRSANAADPPPPPALSPALQAIQKKAIEADGFSRLCPAGEVPQPTRFMSSAATGAQGSSDAPPRGAGPGPHRGGRRRGPRTASASREASGGNWYSWAEGQQLFNGSKGVNGIWAVQTNEQPYIPYGESVVGGHSLAQLWGIRETENGCWSTIETGWIETATYGDVYPHLFVAGYDCQAFMGYAGKTSGMPWVQSSGVIFPNSVLSHNDAFHVYGARMDGNNWWIYYDGQWVGYVPHSAWTALFPAMVTEFDAGGEVATPNLKTCADMGYAGLFGTNGSAAMFSDVWYEYNYNKEASSAYMSKWSSDPSYYTTGHWEAGHPGSEFRYGGPGWC